MKISIIIPVYNTPEVYLNRCLHSMICQKEADIEVILVDDGSKAMCAAQCEALAAEDARIKVFHIENMGVSKARNFGLEQASGDWILFADSDDWFEEHAFSVIDKHLDEQYDMLIFDSYRRTGNLTEHNHYGTEAAVLSGEKIEQLQIQALWKYACDGYYPKYNTVGTPWGKVIRADMIRKYHLKFPENMKIREDMVFMLYALQYSESIKYIQDELYNYRIHSLSAVSKKRSAAEEYEIDRRISEEVKKFNDTFAKDGKFQEVYKLHVFFELLALAELHGYRKKELNQLDEYVQKKKQIAKIRTQYLPKDTGVKYLLLNQNKLFTLHLYTAFLEAAKRLKHLILNKCGAINECARVFGNTFKKEREVSK